MRCGSLSVMALGLMVAACAGQYAQPVAIVQPQHTYSTCTRDACALPRSATLSPDDRTAPTTSRFDSIPVIDVEQVCQGIAQQGGVTFHDPEVPRAKKDCLDSEQEVRSELTKVWASFNASDRTHCVNESKMGGESSYTELFTCLEMARDVRALHEEANDARTAQATRQQ